MTAEPSNGSYAASSNPWYSRIPGHWRVMPFRSVYSKKCVPNTGMRETTVLSLSYGRIVVKPSDKLHGLVPESFETYQVIDPDDIVIRTTDLQNDHKSLRVGRAMQTGIITSAYMCLRTANLLEPAYGFQVLRAFDLSKAIYGFGSGLRQSLDYSHLKYVPIPVPPHDEQRGIVRFVSALDHDALRLIAGKRRLISLLDEQKAALLLKTVTLGLDEDVEIRSSGIDWVGGIPAHWSVIPNRAVLRHKKVTVGDAADDFDLLSLTKRGIIRRDMENPEGKFPAEFNTYQEVEPGDLVFCLFDIDETPRTVGLSTLHGMITGAYTVFSCPDASAREYVNLFYTAMDNGKRLRPMYTGLRKVIGTSRFLSAKMPLPPTPERDALVAHVRSEFQRIDEAIGRAQREVELIQEWRARLVLDAVTGKVDVRQAADDLAELPPESDLGVEDAELECDEGVDTQCALSMQTRVSED